MTGLACLRDPMEDSRGGFVVVALEMDFDQCQVGEGAPGFVAAQAELVGGVGDGPGELVGARELAVDGRGEGSDARAVNLVGDRAADRVGECLLDLGERFGCLPGLEVCACDRSVEVRERASVRPDAADRFRCGAQAGDGLAAAAPVAGGARRTPSRSAR